METGAECMMWPCLNHISEPGRGLIVVIDHVEDEGGQEKTENI
jgi:hypothetical protein